MKQPRQGRQAGRLPAVSACIITRDEADRIEDCLASLAFCDELLVVDSQSRDGTQDRARDLGATVMERQWMGHIAQKEFAIRAARHNWVLCIDADERLSDALRDEIVSCRTGGFRQAPGYHMPRLSLYRGKWMRHGAWYPNRQLRLFDRRQGHWGGTNPHDRVIMNGHVVELRNDLLHIPYRTAEQQLRKIDEYTAIAARELLRTGCPFAELRLVINPLFRVVRSLVLKFGFLDGWRGLALALMEARYARLKYSRLLSLRRENRAQQTAGHPRLAGVRTVEAAGLEARTIRPG